MKLNENIVNGTTKYRIGYYITTLYKHKTTIILGKRLGVNEFDNYDLFSEEEIKIKRNSSPFLFYFTEDKVDFNNTDRICIYTLNEKNKINWIRPLKELPWRNNNNINDDFELDASKCDFNGYHGGSLFFQNNEVPLTSEERLLIYFQYLDHLLTQSLENRYPFFVDSLEEKKEEIAKYVDTVDLDEILKTLTISRSETFMCRPGKDDVYFYDEYTSIEDKSISLDPFLIKFLKIGNVNISKCGAYTSAYNMRNPNHIDGRLFEEESKRKEEFRKTYSREKHIDYLFILHINKQYNIMEKTRDLKEKKESIFKEIDRIWQINNLTNSILLYRLSLQDKKGLIFKFTQEQIDKCNDNISDLFHSYENLIYS